METQRAYDPFNPEENRGYKMLHGEQTKEEERKINGCADIPCIDNCKQCIAQTLGEDQQYYDEDGGYWSM